MTTNNPHGMHFHPIHGHARDGYGLRRTPEYDAWENMKARHREGVSEDWAASFPAFLADVGPRPAPGYVLGRIDRDGGFERTNVAWMTWREFYSGYGVTR
jgi:hypothetical protein